MIEYIAALDASVLQALYDVRDPSLVDFFIFITQFGKSWIVYALALAALLFLALRKKYAYAAGLAISVSSAGIFVLLLKGILERARPDAIYQAYLEIWYSLPSAHAALSVALYGFLAYLAWRMIPNPLLRSLTIVFLLLLTALISISRMYLGVHYVSDIVTGIALGMFCAYLGIRLARFAHQT